MNQNIHNEKQGHVKKPVPVGLLLFLAFIIFILINACLLILASVSVAKDAASRTRSGNNLKAIGKAIHTYEARYSHFPETSIKDETGKPLLSWRVELLPYLGYQALYDQFDLTQPWDSETNKKLISQMPDIFQCPEMDAGEFKTNYLLVVGEETVFTPKGTTRLDEILDGTSNTIIALEADESEAIIWTRPGDLNYDPQNPFKGFPKMRSDSGVFLMADGSVQIIEKTVNELFYKAFMTKAGKEYITSGTSFGI